MTDQFRRDVNEALRLNEAQNRLRRLRAGDPGYLISNRAELADAIGTDKTMINKIIGPKRPTSKIKLVNRSAFLQRIRTVLHLEAVTRMNVPSSRATVLRFLSELPDEEFKIFEDEVRRRSRNHR